MQSHLHTLSAEGCGLAGGPADFQGARPSTRWNTEPTDRACTRPDGVDQRIEYSARPKASKEGTREPGARRCRGRYGDVDVAGWAPDCAERRRAEHAGLAIGRGGSCGSRRQARSWWE